MLQDIVKSYQAPAIHITDSFSGCIYICTLISVQNDALCLAANQICILNPDNQVMLRERIAIYNIKLTEFDG